MNIFYILEGNKKLREAQTKKGGVNMLKRLLSLILVITMIFGVAITTFGVSQPISISLNGAKFTGEAYINEEGKVMVPLRQISEELGYMVEWNNNDKSVTVSKESDVMELKIGKSGIITNGKDININSNPIIKNGKTFVPVEVFSNALDLIIGWDKKHSILNINQPIKSTEEFFAMATDETISNILDTYMKALAENRNFHGSVLVAKEGKVLLNKGYEFADLDQNTMNKSQTKFAIGSITKQFTAMAIMQLSEKGLINVNDNLSKYLPDFPNGELITIHNLLTHSSGLVDYLGLIEFDKVVLDNKDAMDILSIVENEGLMFNPGEAFNYSNTNYLILGILVEKLSGMSYEDYLQKNIFDPVNMENTGICYGKDNEIHDATAYSGFLESAPIDDEGLLQIAYGAGNIYSTVEDLYRWDQALKTEKLVKGETLNQIFSEHVAMPGAGSYGYGWMIVDSGVGKMIFHGGNTLGFTANLIRFIDIDMTIIILSNNGYYDLTALTNSLTSISLGGPYELPDALVEIEIENPDLYDKYIGEYELAPGAVCTITKEDNRLFAQITGQEGFEIFPSSENNFFYKAVDAKIIFEKDEEGNVTHLVIYQMGQEIPALKIK